jgi:hypothetical protein
MTDFSIQSTLDYWPPEAPRSWRGRIGIAMATTAGLLGGPAFVAFLLIDIFEIAGRDWQNRGVIRALLLVGFTSSALGLPFGFIGMRFFGNRYATIATFLCYASLLVDLGLFL